MVCNASDQEIFANYQELCNDLDLEEGVLETSWNNYIAVRENYTLEGDPVQWLATSVYVECRICNIRTVSKMDIQTDWKPLSLIKLLNECKITMLQFIDKCKKWVDLLNMPANFRKRVDLMENIFAVSTMIYSKFKSIFADMFSCSTQNELKTLSGSRKSVEQINTLKVMEFLWTLYLVVKSKFSGMAADLVNSYHLLLACCDLIFANAVRSKYSGINPRFPGLPEDYYQRKSGFDGTVICVIDTLCERHDGVNVEARGVREYQFKSEIKELVKKDVLRCDHITFMGMLDSYFPHNLKSINKLYDEYVISVGGFDERLFMDKSDLDLNDGQSKVSCNTPIKVEAELSDISSPASMFDKLKGYTPLTNRSYLIGREEETNALSPVKSATAIWSSVCAMLEGYEAEPSEKLTSLLNSMKPVESGCLIEKIADYVEIMAKAFLSAVSSISPQQKSDIAEKHLILGVRLYYKLFENVLSKEKNVDNLAELLWQDLFHKVLFGCSLEIVIFSQNLQLGFPWISHVLKVHPFHFYKILELIVRTEPRLSRTIVKHLNTIEEQVLESLSWSSDSPLWDKMKELDLPAPTSEQTRLTQKCKNDPNASEIIESKSDANIENTEKYGSTIAFFRKFYNLASVRMRNLCEHLNITDEEVLQKLWTCFEQTIINHLDIVKDRHLDQIIMCTVYVICKVLEINQTFHEIMKCYRYQPQSSSHIYRSVLIKPRDELSNGDKTLPERADLIQFYNKVYITRMESIALKFSTRSNLRDSNLMLSPVPSMRINVSPRYRVSDTAHMYVRNFSDVTLPTSPTKQFSYIVTRSPAKNLQEINEAVFEFRKKQQIDDKNKAGIAASKRLRGLLEERMEHSNGTLTSPPSH